jgi:hypothetical protein
MAELAALQNAYRGETVVFIGNGTSIRPYDLSRIRHRIAACNYFIPFGLERWGLTLDLYLCHDPRVFFVPWERYRAFKQIVPADDSVSRAPSPAEYIEERELYRKTKLILPASLQWYGGFHSHPVFAGADTAQFTRWLPRQLARGADLFVYHIEKGGGSSLERIRRSLRKRLFYGGSYKAHGFDPRGYDYSVPRWADRFLPPIASAAFMRPRGGKVTLPMWAINSMCCVIIPILFFLEFDTIILMGVDYDKQGYFFNPYTNPQDQFYYREEFDQLYFLFRLARMLPHAPKIKIVRTAGNNITPPDGFVAFEEICA